MMLIFLLIPLLIWQLTARVNTLRRFRFLLWSGYMLMVSPGLFLVLITIIEAGATSTANATTGVPYAAFINQSAATHGVNPLLVAAVIDTESNWDALAVPPACEQPASCARGLMQIMPDTAEDLGLTAPFNPRLNIDAGTRYLAQLITQFDGDMDKAIMAYHGGMGRISRGEARPIDRQYLATVKAAMAEMGTRLDAEGPEVALPYVDVEPTTSWVLHGLSGWEGVDFATPCGTALVSPVNGVVTYIGRDGYVGPYAADGAQNTMLTITGDEVEVTMLHGQYTVAMGQRLPQGQPIGAESNIGNVRNHACHTHFITKIDGRVVHPSALITGG